MTVFFLFFTLHCVHAGRECAPAKIVVCVYNHRLDWRLPVTHACWGYIICQVTCANLSQDLWLMHV